MAESLKKKTVKGVAWSAADAILGYSITFLVGIVLARLLSPAEYGLIGICTIFITVISGFVDSGFSNSLIRKKEVTDNDYNTMFITNMLMSIVLYVVLFCSAPFISDFFDRPELTILIRVMGFVLILQALSLVQYTRLTKRIDFKTKTKASLIAAVLSGCIGIGMAYTGFGVWSLVGQKLSERAIFTVCLWRFNKWCPNLAFDTNSFRYMWGFGWKLMVSGLLDRIWRDIYQLVVGKCYSPATLGQYSRAKEYSHLFSSNLTIIIQRVTFPTLAALQDDKVRMMGAYRRIIKVTMFVTAVCMLSLGAVAEPFIYCLIGTKWHQAATFLPLICISMSLYPLHAINLNMLQVQGRSDIFLYIEIAKKVVSIGPICLGIFVGIYWMIVGSIITGIIAFFLNSYYTGKSLHYSSWQQLRDVAPSYVIGFIIALSVYFLKYLPFSYYVILSLQLITGLMVFYVICNVMKLREYQELKTISSTFLKKILK